MTRPEHRHKPPEPANEKMGMGHNRRLWVALSGQRHGTSRLRRGEPPAGTLTRARTAAPTPAAASASASGRAAGTSTTTSGRPPRERKRDGGGKGVAGSEKRGGRRVRQ